MEGQGGEGPTGLMGIDVGRGVPWLEKGWRLAHSKQPGEDRDHQSQKVPAADSNRG